MLKTYLPFLFSISPLIWLLVEAWKVSFQLSVYTPSQIFWLFTFNLGVTIFLLIVLYTSHISKRAYITMGPLLVISVLVLLGAYLSEPDFASVFGAFIPTLPKNALYIIMATHTVGAVLAKLSYNKGDVPIRESLSAFFGIVTFVMTFFIILFWGGENGELVLTEYFVIAAVPVLLFFEVLVECNKKHLYFKNS